MVLIKGILFDFRKFESNKWLILLISCGNYTGLVVRAYAHAHTNVRNFLANRKIFELLFSSFPTK